MITKRYDDILEELIEIDHKSGLKVYIIKKPKFNKTYVSLTTKFGSNNSSIIDETGKVTTIPKGIAHFLEHKLFERNGEDISTVFAQNGASVNAYTMNNRTTYLFTATKKKIENTKLLLDFVFNPLFTKKGIEKEKSIIAQEIKMYQDQASSVAYSTLQANLYETHPIKDDILGSIESIKAIDKEILKKTHTAYYHPSNMVLLLTGNVDVKKVETLLDSYEIKTKQTHFPNHVTYNDESVFKDETVLYKDISTPNLMLGILGPNNNKDIMKTEAEINIMLDIYFGKSSDIYLDLLDKGLINDSFGMDVAIDTDYSYFLLGIESNKIEEFIPIIKDLLLKMKDYKITDEEFIRTKKLLLGSFIHSFNSIEAISSHFLNYRLLNEDPFELIKIIENITKDDIYESTRFISNIDDMTIVKILKKKNRNL
ncbi:hypothetical protein CI105_05010 [Candidatus Izimaplasma bacterium ZiA1]|uniref:EF-P 5-aminopentanol modification-associated protein YfmH n=1 Tax=Candidatus Izimoplasma sp. ZiA1 TaxID=2024899 RepID=UPI000BAA44EA|nr:hypothetical protein CI105_05010 [Candidatus Izimaplasma bacterium ZiA1]